MKGDATLAALALHFFGLSLLAVGGATAVIPEMHRQAVEVAGWMSDRQFAELFAISQVAPGPNILIVTLVGFQVAAVPGALVATVAMCGPSCLLAYLAERAWQHFRHSRWRVLLQAAIVPLSVGLVAATSLIVARAADNSVIAILLTAGTASIAYFTRIHPLWMFALAAAVGYAGLV